jgi:hypothetical protein
VQNMQDSIVRWKVGCVPSKSSFGGPTSITMACEGLQKLGLCSVLMAIKQGGIFMNVPHL